MSGTVSSRSTLNAHGAAPHMKAYADRTNELIASRVIRVLEPA